MDQQRLRELLTSPADNRSAISALLESELKDAMILVGNVRTTPAFQLLQLVLNRAHTKGPDDAVRWVSKVLSATEVSVLTVMPLWGLEVSPPVDLTDSIRLSPLNEVPKLLHRPEETIGAAGVEMYLMRPPKTALVARTLQKLFVPNDFKINPKAHDVLHELRLCLTLVAPSVIVPAALQFVFEDSDFADLAYLCGYTRRHLEFRPIVLRSFGEFDAERTQRLAHAYLSFDANDRERMHLAIDRFDRALSRLAPGDAAVELAISLESLVGDSEGGELTWKVGLRSALLAGGTKSARLERRAIIHGLYSLRSKVVHRGRATNS